LGIEPGLEPEACLQATTQILRAAETEAVGVDTAVRLEGPVSRFGTAGAVGNIVRGNMGQTSVNHAKQRDAALCLGSACEGAQHSRCDYEFFHSISPKVCRACRTGSHFKNHANELLPAISGQVVKKSA